MRGNGTPRHCARRRRNPSDDRRGPGSAGPSSVTAGEIIGLLSEMPGVIVETASEATGALRWHGATVSSSMTPTAILPTVGGHTPSRCRPRRSPAQSRHELVTPRPLWPRATPAR